jgi:hypothetical protein
VGVALEPIARLAEACAGQVVLGESPCGPHAEGERHTGLPVGPDAQDHRHPDKHLTVLVRPDPGGLPQQPCCRFRHARVSHDERTPRYSEQGASRQVEEWMPRPGPLEHAGHLIVGGAVNRVSHGGARGPSGQIPQRHEVSPEWLRQRVVPPQGDSLPFLVRVSMTA